MLYTITVRVEVAIPPQACGVMLDFVREMKSFPNPQIKLVEARLLDKDGNVEVILDEHGKLVK